jgi:hypothetical protein
VVFFVVPLDQIEDGFFSQGLTSTERGPDHLA